MPHKIIPIYTSGNYKEGLPITDNHIPWIQVNGDGPLEVAKKFQKAGGTVMIIPNKPTWTLGESYNLQEAMGRLLNTSMRSMKRLM